MVIGLAVLDPDLALTLWVDEQREPSRLGDNQTVLDGQLVARQTFQVPLADRRVVHQHADNVQILAQPSSVTKTFNALNFVHIKYVLN